MGGQIKYFYNFGCFSTFLLFSSSSSSATPSVSFLFWEIGARGGLSTKKEEGNVEQPARDSMLLGEMVSSETQRGKVIWAEGSIGLEGVGSLVVG